MPRLFDLGERLEQKQFDETVPEGHYRFKELMRQIESSGGKNTDHARIPSGIHAGEKAIGELGIMPNTAMEMKTRMRREGFNEPVLSEATNKEEVVESLTDPISEDNISKMLYKKLHENYGGDLEKMNYAYEQGHNIPSKKLTKERLEKSPRTRRFRELIKKSP